MSLNFSILPTNTTVIDYAHEIQTQLLPLVGHVDIDDSYGLSMNIRIQRHLTLGKNTVILDDTCKQLHKVKVKFYGKHKQESFEVSDFIDLILSFKELEEETERINISNDIESGNETKKSIQNDTTEESFCLIM
jgi:threonyl-tRNA synthetase